MSASGGSPICVWWHDPIHNPAHPDQDAPKGYYWDDAEDHGGHDRISPRGPFSTAEKAKADAEALFSVSKIYRHAPLHYSEWP